MNIRLIAVLMTSWLASHANAESQLIVEESRRVLTENSIVDIPTVGRAAEAEIGQTILSKAKLSTWSTILVKHDVKIEHKAGFFDNNWSFSRKIPAGTTLRKHLVMSSGSLYQDDNFSPSIAVLAAGVFVPNDSTKAATYWRVNKGTLEAGDVRLGEDPVQYENQVQEKWESTSFRRELIYGGVFQNTLTINYREFIDNTARPAFSQEFKYDLSQGDLIGFKGARFQIIKASNTTLTYKVIKPLD